MRKFKEKDNAPLNACSTVKLTTDTYKLKYPKCRIRKDLPKEEGYVYALIPFERIAADGILEVWGIPNDGSDKYKTTYVKIVNETLRYPTKGMLEKLEKTSNMSSESKENIKKIIAIVDAYQAKLKEKNLDFLEPLSFTPAPKAAETDTTKKIPPVEKNKKTLDELLRDQPTKIKYEPVPFPNKNTEPPVTKEENPVSIHKDTPETTENLNSLSNSPLNVTENENKTTKEQISSVDVPKTENKIEPVSDKTPELEFEAEDSIKEQSSVKENIASDTGVKEETDYTDPVEVELDLDFDVNAEIPEEEENLATPESLSISPDVISAESKEVLPVEKRFYTEEELAPPKKNDDFDEIDFSQGLTVDELFGDEFDNDKKASPFNSNTNNISHDKTKDSDIKLEPSNEDEVLPDDYFDDMFDEEPSVNDSNDTKASPETVKPAVQEIPEQISEKPIVSSVETLPTEEDDDDDDIYKNLFT